LKIPNELKLLHIPRGCRPRCGAVTRSGRPCRAQALVTGLCAIHSKLMPGGPATPEAKERAVERGREHMNRMWSERWYPNGRNMTPEGLERIRQGQKRRSPESRKHTPEACHKISQARRRLVEAQKNSGASR
jgi:hypothetical protein